MSDPNWRLIDQRLEFIDRDITRLDRRLDEMLRLLIRQQGERISKLEQRLMTDKGRYGTSAAPSKAEQA